ncbi:TraB/GumN family protein [Sphingomonas sp. HT-1]|uniref:TraB/GumN family protein n=1 Tax=unclassified Sphingomonas TaxID=196159 RepID=UPI0002DCF14C|nr:MULTISPECIES: TraB/GumN family protein [unclassified Sphingomonas]KTF67906.1 polysaccharide biosynthesis protein GumN [Sphingomonas sp. WG]
MLRALLFTALFLLGSCGAAPRDAKPALWAVRDGDTTIYLFGTVHLLRPDLRWFQGPVRTAFDASDTLVLELVMPPEAETQALLDQLGRTPGDPKVEALPPPEHARLEGALRQAGLSPQALDRDEPWLAALTLSLLPLQKLGYDDASGAEKVLQSAAQGAGKTVQGLETAEQQFGYFDHLSAAAQTRLLGDTLDGLPGTGATIEAMIVAWSNGDADGLARLLNADLAGNPELRDTLLIARNRNWARWIAARMRRPGTVFVAVGAGHLAGGQSVLAMLEQAGLKVERLQ